LDRGWSAGARVRDCAALPTTHRATCRVFPPVCAHLRVRDNARHALTRLLLPDQLRTPHTHRILPPSRTAHALLLALPGTTSHVYALPHGTLRAAFSAWTILSLACLLPLVSTAHRLPSPLRTLPVPPASAYSTIPSAPFCPHTRLPRHLGRRGA